MALNFYSAAANKAAANTPACASGGCPACEKVGLPMLLVRAGVADKSYAQDAARTAATRVLMESKVPAPHLPTSGHVARTLRPGYVIAYYEKSHTPTLKSQRGWEAFKVHEGGYLTPHPLEGSASGKEEEAFSCRRTAAYASAMLFVIQDARNAGKVWVAYSDHLWSPEVRHLYGNDKTLRRKRMTKIDASDASCSQSLPLTGKLVQTAVADYDPARPASAFRGNPFAPLPGSAKPGVPHARPETAGNLHAEAQRILEAGNNASKKKPYSPDDVMLVGLIDPIGATAETAQRRITLCNDAAEWVVTQASGYQKLQTGLTIEGLLKRADEQAQARKAPLSDPQYAGLNGKEVSEKEFKDLTAAGKLPPEATLEPKYEYNPYDVNGDGRTRVYGRGIISFPSASQIDRQATSLKEDILDGVTGGKRRPAHRTFLDSYKAKIKEDRQRLERLELDYQVWLQSEQRKLITSFDFDETTPSDGIFYAVAVGMCTHGGPITDRGTEWFKDFLLNDPNDKETLLVRSLLGNQKSAFESFHDAFKPTKVHKEIKNLFKLIEEIEKAVAAGTPLPAGDKALLRALPQIRWLAQQLPLLKNLASTYGHLTLTVVGATSMALDKLQQLPAPVRDKLQTLTESITNTLGKAVGVTVHKVSISLDKAAAYWRQQMGMVRGLAQRAADAADSKQVKSLVLGGAMWFSVGGKPGTANTLIDVYVAVRQGTAAVPGAVDAATAAGAKAGSNARAAVGASADAVADLARRFGKTGADVMRESIAVFKQGSATFSAAGALLQVFSISKTWHTLETGTQEERTYASITLLTTGLGVTGALLEISEAYAKQLGKTASALGLKLVAGSASAISLLFDAVGAFLRFRNEKEKGDSDSSAAYLVQSLFFVGAAFAGGMYVASTAGWITGTIAAGWGLSWTGWGLLLLGLGLIAGYVAMLLNDAPTVEWVKRSIWGDASDKWGNLQKEQNELNKVLLGVRVDFYAGIKTTLQGGVVGLGAPIMMNVPTNTYEAWTRLFIPVQLRELVKYELGFSVVGTENQRKKWKFNAEGKIIEGPNTTLFPLEINDESITHRVEMPRDALNSIQGNVKIWDAPEGGELIVDESLVK